MVQVQNKRLLARRNSLCVMHRQVSNVEYQGHEKQFVQNNHFDH